MKNIHMGLNENPNNLLSKKLNCFLKKNLSQAVCYYPDPNASSLKELLAKKFNLAPQNFFISNGSDEILFILGSIMTDVKYVICPQNTFNSYKYLANLYKKTLIETPLLNYVVDIEKLIKKIRPNSMLIIPNPHNPCGTYIGKEKLEELIKSCKNKKAYLVVDEAYGEFAEAEKDDYLSALSLSNYSRMIVIRTFSKFYGKGIFHSFKYNIFDNVKSIIYQTAPNVDAFKEYDNILMEASKVDKNKLVIIVLGPTATILAYDLALKGYQALDMGHIAKAYDRHKRGFRDKKFWAPD